MSKIALVTGAGRGIGKEVMLKLASDGFIVVGADRSPSGVESIDAYLKEANLTGSGVLMDVTNREQIAEAIKTIKARYEAAPSVLVNNAGITRDGLALRMSREQWDAVISTNLTAIFEVTQACLPSMLKANWGRIISIASVVAYAGNPGQVNYSAAKAGIVGFSRSLAKEIASRQVTVNCVAPGFIATNMTEQLDEAQRAALLNMIPMRRMGTTTDVAAAVSFLASEAASYITGNTIHVNGGMYCS